MRYISFYLSMSIFLILSGCVTSRNDQNPAANANSVNRPIFNPDTQFEKIDPGYKAKQIAARRKLESLKERLFQFQSQGKNMTCSRQISEEASWLINYSADFQRIESRLHDLETSLSPSFSQGIAMQESPIDGSWGACYQEWFWKVVESTEAIKKLKNQDQVPSLKTSSLDRINSPEKLNTYLNSILVTDVAKNKINSRRELNESVSAITRLILRRLPRNYAWHPDIKRTLLTFMDEKWQNQETGYWGAWYVDNGQLIKTDDLSITFHIVSYREGEVSHWDKLVNTTIKIKDRPYPFGWRHSDGEMSNHHNYDVVRLFRLGWAFLSTEQKITVRQEIQKMLDFCLTDTLNRDGSFKYNRSDDSLGDSYAFGVGFLDEVGYWSREKRFWTDDRFAKAEQVRLTILDSLNKMKDKDRTIKETIKLLQETGT